ncbi:MAG: histidinol phosphate phosphatase domain-containing protein [Chloroflexi bacterium]|nr:histidinol phosphate phosphatase domain-containing protein [Chloroflexota bacterium]
MHDFHTHTFLSDGCLSPLEIIRRACVAGYQTIAITDHAGIGSIPRMVEEVRKDCALAREYWNILAIPGIELTHLPPEAIAGAALKAKQAGAAIVVVHGETLNEPVIKGTNLAAVKSPHVDILAHPGTLTSEEASIAARNGIFIEITTRPGHNRSNADVAEIARQAGALAIINSDAHEPEDLLCARLVEATARTAGMVGDYLHLVTETNPVLLAERIRPRLI